MDKILIIDDEQTVLHVLHQSLRDMPFDIILSDNPKIAMDLFVEHKPFLIILDMNMGDISGLDFIDYLIEYENKKTECPDTVLTLKNSDFFVLILTGYGNKEMMQKCCALGVEYFLNKPVHINTLRNVVETMHRLKASRDELKKLSDYQPEI
jgi:CheY-like chemotaxis protein